MLIGILIATVTIFSVFIAILIFRLTKPKIDGATALQQKVLEELQVQLKEFAKIPALLTNPAGLKQIGEKNLEFLLENVLPKDFVLTQFEMPGTGIVDTAIKIGDRILPIDSKFTKLNEDKKIQFAAMKDRVKEAAKYISPKHSTTPFVLLYCHSELIYIQCFVENSELLSFAMKSQVIPVSPSTIYLYLLTMMDAIKRIEVSKNQINILQDIKQSISIFEAAKVLSDKSSKQLRDSLTNSENSSKKIQDALDYLNNLIKGSEK